MTFDPLVLAGLLVSSAIALLAPLGLAAFVWRRFRPWPLAAALGAGTFLVFQLATRIPVIALVTPAVQEALRANEAWAVPWIGLLSFTAGLFEETGRWVAYRVFPRLRTRANGLMLGVGHGGIEAMLLVGVNVAVSAVLYWFMSTGRGLPLPIPQEQVALVERQFSALTPGVALMGGLERCWSLMVHCGLSLVVLEGFRRGERRWLWLAMAFHGGSNFVAVLVSRSLGPYVAEAVIGVFGLAALAWTVRWMKQGDGPAPAAPAQP